jgi:hypothetical protein
MSNADEGERDPEPGFSGGGTGDRTGGGSGGTGGNAGSGGNGETKDEDTGSDTRAPVVTHPDRFAWAPYVVGLAVLVGYTIFLSVMIGEVRQKEQTFWDRYLYLFSSVEALAFAAAGFFFGREVNRGRAEAAESQAKAEANRASTAEKKASREAARGEALSEGVRNMFEGAGDTPEVSRSGADLRPSAASAGQQVAVPAQQIRGLVNLADRWYPRR